MVLYDTDAIARDVIAVQGGASRIEPFTTRFPDFDLPAAYRVAEAVRKRRCDQGAVPVGRKIGFTNPEMWSLYGVRRPIWGYMYDTTVTYADDGRSVCGLGMFAEPRIEPEVVFGLRCAPPASGDPADIVPCLDWYALGFEIVQSHFPGWRFRAPDAVADGSLHGALIVGEPRRLTGNTTLPAAELERFSLSLVCDGELRETGVGANVLGSPLTALAHLTGLLADAPTEQRIRAGEIVTTGTITTAHVVAPGERWEASVDGLDLPGLSVEFAA
jgi:2-oxo-3-hexenedioate decarboxylase